MKNKWVPFAKDGFAAETPFRVRAAKDAAPTTAVFNQFGQLLDASTRRVVDPAPAEMEVVEDEAPPFKP